MDSYKYVKYLKMTQKYRITLLVFEGMITLSSGLAPFG